MSEKPLILRRRSFVTGLATLGGALLTGCSDELPPSYGNILRMGDAFTYGAHRLLLPRQSLAKEFTQREISSIPATGTTDPADSAQPYYAADAGVLYGQLKSNAFADWRLTIEGKVARPGSYSMADLQRMPTRTQITRHTCEEGWTAIAEWTGVPLRHVLEAAGILPSARFVQFYAFDDVADGIDMLDALHPQTILAWGMNGRELPIGHGAPLRLRVEKQMGYKSMKFLRRIVVTDAFDDLGMIQSGWSWYAGI